MTYNYHEAVKEDLKDYILEYMEAKGLGVEALEDEDFREEIYDNAFLSDMVTGNGSGSYTFNTWRAENNLNHNWDILKESLEEFDCMGVNIIKKGAEWCDVTIRCYILSQVIDEALKECEGAFIPLF